MGIERCTEEGKMVEREGLYERSQWWWTVLSGRATSGQENQNGLWRVRGRIVREVCETRSEKEYPEHQEKN